MASHARYVGRPNRSCCERTTPACIMIMLGVARGEKRRPAGRPADARRRSRSRKSYGCRARSFGLSRIILARSSYSRTHLAFFPCCPSAAMNTKDLSAWTDADGLTVGRPLLPLCILSSRRRSQKRDDLLFSCAEQSCMGRPQQLARRAAAIGTNCARHLRKERGRSAGNLLGRRAAAVVFFVLLSALRCSAING